MLVPGRSVLAKLDKDVLAKITSTTVVCERDQLVRKLGASYRQRWSRAASGKELPEFKLGPITSSVEDEDQGQELMQPKVIQYDSMGRPVTKQDEKAAGNPTEVYGWRAFLDTSCAVDAMEEMAFKSLIIAHVQLLHQNLPALTEVDVKVSKVFNRGSGAGSLQVTALKNMDAGRLHMAPLLFGPGQLSRISKASRTPHVLKVQVTRDRFTTDWYINGTTPLPSPASSAQSTDTVVSSHAWSLSHNPWPLWHVKRVSSTDAASCHFQNCLARMLSTFAPEQAEASSDNFDISIPVLVNKVALVAGQELVVDWTPTSKSSPAQKVSKNLTWDSDAHRNINKQAKK